MIRSAKAIAASLLALALLGGCAAADASGPGRVGPATSAPQQSVIVPFVPDAAADAAATATPPAATGTIETTATFNKKKYSWKTPSSPWVVVNKLRRLSPKTYTPSDIVTLSVAHANPPRMRKGAGAALVRMFAVAKKEDGGAMQVQSAYRSYSTQVSVYNGWVKSLGKAKADQQSARPGFSEHQTGLAVDISTVPSKCGLAACFSTTKQGKWLWKNAYRFGFLMRYPKSKTAVTGYTYEPWHYRYVGKALAKEMHSKKVLTLEEFFGLPAAPDYAK
jgi:D-alanyl-D-alanine carboxypeptidase